MEHDFGSMAALIGDPVRARILYYSFSRPEVAYAVESLAGLLPRRSGPAAEKEDLPIRVCRTCYDHLAGKIGVQVTESMVRRRLIRFVDSTGDLQGQNGGVIGLSFEVTPKGIRFFKNLGIDCEALRRQRRGFARVCLDWTERRPHLGGSLGAALLLKMMDEHWLRRIEGTRAVRVTPKGRKAINEVFGIPL